MCLNAKIIGIRRSQLFISRNPSSILGIEEQYCHLWGKRYSHYKKEKQAPSLGCNTASTPRSTSASVPPLSACPETAAVSSRAEAARRLTSPQDEPGFAARPTWA